MSDSYSDKDDIRLQAHDWCAKWSDGSLSMQEQKAFEQWHQNPEHANAYSKAKFLWQSLAELDYPEELDQPLLRERLLNAYSKLKRWFSHSAGRKPLVALTMSAVLAVPIYLLVLLPSSPSVALTYQSHAQITEFVLEDGSVITLAPNSKFSFTQNEVGRYAELQAGIGYFDIAPWPEKPFTVGVGHTQVKVLGTEFELQKRKNSVLLAVNEGKVAISTSSLNGVGENSYQLTAGQRIKADNLTGLSQIQSVVSSRVASWRSGRLVYVDALLEDIIEDADRYSDLDIRIDKSARHYRLSATFERENIDAMLNTLTEALPIKLVHVGNIVVVKAK